ncbi:MAG: 30S ribosomal protein S18 [Candidatus Zipacnadales bacterium]
MSTEEPNRTEKLRKSSRGRPKTGPRRKRKKVCNFCADQRTFVADYKHLRIIREYLDERGRIRKARQTGTCRKHQRKLARAIKRARQLALLAYTTD